jgi:LruC domain-containing protein
MLGLLQGCSPDNDPVGPAANPSFDYATRRVRPVALAAEPALAGAAFALYTDAPGQGGRLLQEGRLDEQGRFDQRLRLPSSLGSVFLESRAVGLPGGFSIPLDGEGGFRWSLDDDRGKTQPLALNASRRSAGKTQSGPAHYRMPVFDQQGVPNNLLQPGDQLTHAFLSAMTASLPEGKPVPSYNPTYLASGNQTDLVITDSADVWVTFVHEGAGYKNTLGYYVYPLDSPPTTATQIDTVYILYPNVSFNGSGGGLQSGDKQYLGAFGPRTGIGWVLLQDAYRRGAVNTSQLHLYSNPDFNPEPQAEDRQHTVLLYDQTRERVVIGFEDIARDNAACDQDFNDALFFASANPIASVDRSRMPRLIEEGQDSDGDRVPDAQDAYPNEAAKAFNAYTPFENGFGSYAFEDLWPSRGDYDFNDLVVDYNYRQVLNRANALVSMEWTFVVRHIGASYHNGFGLAMPLTPSAVQSVQGQALRHGLVRTDARGLEAGQSQAVAMIFDDAFDHLGDTLRLQIALPQPVNLSNFNAAGLNPFVFANGQRGREIHLPDHAPTDLMDSSFFGRADDRSAPGRGRWYRDPSKKPWAMEISHAYAPPVETQPIEKAYRYFNEWVQSRGSRYPGWYEPKPGYRNSALVQ